MLQIYALLETLLVNVIKLMGALTLKNFPFELRGWDIEKFASIDPTDGFGSHTRVFISKQQIVQIEPDYNKNVVSAWLTDKGRQFFDSISNFKQNESFETKPWYSILKSLFKTLYFFNLYKNKRQQNYFFIILVENINIEIVSLLVIISQNFSFIKIKRSEKIKLNNDLESNFQLNVNFIKKSTLILLIANNPRYEGYLLNINLRQRFLKGNFKCFVLGSVIDLTFPISFLGSKLNIFKKIAEGNSLICQDLKSANNPALIFNTEMFKRIDGKNSFEMIKLLNYSNILNKIWNSNVLNSSLSETGLQSIKNFPYLNIKDLSQFSSFYFLNLTMNNISNFKKVTETKLLNFNKKKYLKTNKLFINQTSGKNEIIIFYNKKQISTSKNFNKYFYLPVKKFYENEGNYINTEGLIKFTSKLISKKKTKDNWKLLRNFFKQSKKNLIFLNSSKKDLIIFYNLKKKLNFKNFITFHYKATHNIQVNSFIFSSNQPLIGNKMKFKNKKLKLFNTKMKYWLDDFFIGGKDGYSHNSLILTNCSNTSRSQNTNFF